MLVGTVEITLLILLVSILLGPILGAKLKVPGLLALIFLGMFFGPFGIAWLGRLGLVSDLGTIGILYLMFLAGLGFNINAFMENRTSAIGVGLLSFIIPFGLSIMAVLTFYEAGILAAALIGAMWASNTLVAYPDVRAAGLEDTRPVRDAVSAGVVADVLSLLVLAFVTSQAVVEAVDPLIPGATSAPSLPLFLTVPALVVFALWILPRIGSWFFTRVGRSRPQRLVFALAAMAASASLAVVAGLEGIIGAFLGGIGLNRLVPKNSELMDRIDFVGSTVFIPAFLVSIGLRIDPRALVDAETVGMGLAFTALVIVGKSVAVTFTKPFTKYSFAEGGLVASLSFGQAASTLAIAQVGLELGLFRQQVVNASVLAIVATALVTSFGTQFFIRRVPAPPRTHPPIGDRVLLDARGDGTEIGLLTDFAGRIARGDGGIEILFTVSPVADKITGRRHLAEAEEAAAAGGYDVDKVARLSDSFIDGAVELIAETDASLIILGWSGPRLGSDYLFGSEVDAIGSMTPVPAIAVHLIRPWKRLIVVPGSDSVEWHAEDAGLALEVATRLSQPDDLPLVVLAPSRDLIDSGSGQGGDKIDFVQATTPGETLLRMVKPDDLVIAPAYLLPGIPLPRRLRLASQLAECNLAVIAGAGKLSVSPGFLSNFTTGIVGPKI